MPRLRSVTIYQRGAEPHGMSWPALCAVLSHPVIREFTLDRLHFCPVLRPSDELPAHSFAPLTSFQYLFRTPELLSYMPFSTNNPNPVDERAALDVVLGALYNTLEVLSLVSETATLQVISQHPWPDLRRLVLRGELSEALASSLLPATSHISNLRSLVLKFSPMGQTRRGLFWQGSRVVAFPFLALEELVITYPDPADQLFDHLPPTLLSLFLGCWRHLYHDFLDPYGSGEPRDGLRFELLLQSSALQQVLHRARTPLLVRLTLEYRADDGDDKLLYHIAHTYPPLTYLKLIRYRHHGVDDVPVVSDHRMLESTRSALTGSQERIARALAPQARLHKPKLHLDLLEMPVPNITLAPDGLAGYSTGRLRQFRVIVKETVDIWARASRIWPSSHRPRVARGGLAFAWTAERRLHWTTEADGIRL